MKILDRIVGVLIMLLGVIHSTFSPVFHGHYDDVGMWVLSGGLMMIFLGMMNLVRSASPGNAARRGALAANLLGLTFALALVPLFPLRQNPQVAILIVLVVASTIFSLPRRGAPAA